MSVFLGSVVQGTTPVTGEGVFDFRYGPFTGGVPESGIFHYPPTEKRSFPWRLSSAAVQKIGSSFYGSFFERALRLTKGLPGRRGLRDIVPGGVSIPPTQERIGDLAEQIERFRQDFERTHRRMLSSRNFLDRLYRTATVDRDRALLIGFTGPSLRTTGTKGDLRSKEPLIEEFQPKGENEGDSFARMDVRAREFIEFCAIIAGLYRRTSWTGGPSESLPEMSGEGQGTAESPSGTIAWVVGTKNGKICYAVVSPPSLFGFQAYAESVVGNIFTDVPFAYESFGVSFADAGR